MPDAVVIGAGPNGLVAANVLVDAGWSVVLLEANAEPGGAVKSEELTLPGFTHDVFSAFYPLAAASGVISSLDLHEHGLRWKRAPLALAHPTPDGLCPVLATDPTRSGASLDGDGDAAEWEALQDLWDRVGAHVTRGLFRPFPPVAPAALLAGELGGRGLLDLARFAALPVRRLAEERFAGRGAGLLLAGSALHSDLAPESIPSAFLGWLLCSLAQDVGWPVPEGGAGRLATALGRRFESKGGTLICDAHVTKLEIRGERVHAAVTADGRTFDAGRAVLADVAAPRLFLSLVGAEHLPSRTLRDIERFQYDNATVKVDWALDGPVPWEAEDARRAGTVHLADDMDQMTEYAAQLHVGLVPDRPFLVIGQMTTTDPSRSPAGTETAWAYAHVPQAVRGDAGGVVSGRWDAHDLEAFTSRIEERIERLAPGFRDRVIGRHVMGPHEMEARNANLVGGAVNGGTAQLHQQLIFRPITGLGRPETPIRDLYLASASAHPGGGVHGAPGANAATAALKRWRRRTRTLPLAALAAGTVIAGSAGRRLRG